MKYPHDISGNVIHGLKVLQLQQDDLVLTKQKYRVECCRCHGISILSRGNIIYTRAANNSAGCKLCVSKTFKEKGIKKEEKEIEVPLAAHKIISLEQDNPQIVINLDNADNEVKYDKDKEYLEEIGIAKLLRDKFKEIVPYSVFEFYLNKTIEKIRPMMENQDFFIDMDEKILNVFNNAVSAYPFPIKEKIIEKERVKEVVKTVKLGSDNPLDNIYTPERILKEYPKFFINLLQVNNLIHMHLDKLIGHVLQIGNQYIADETGVIILMELADKTDEVYPLNSSIPKDIIFKQQEEIVEEVEEKTKEYKNDTLFDEVCINETLLDKSKRATISIEKCKALYNRNKALYDSLNAFRYESDIHQNKVSVSKSVFDEYCNDKTRNNEEKYLIMKSAGIIHLVLKKSDFDRIMEEYFRNNKLFTRVSNVVNQWRSFGFIEKSKENPNSYVLNYTKIKEFIIEKGGLLNSIEYMK